MTTKSTLKSYQNRPDEEFRQMLGLDLAKEKDRSATYIYTGTPAGGSIHPVKTANIKKGA